MEARAELKVEGGKLLRADLVFDDEIQDFNLHGDFFVYAEEALEDIQDAVEEMPADTSPERLSESIEHSLPAGTELVGFQPENVAELVRRAIDDEE